MPMRRWRGVPQHADWVGHTVEVASANKIYLGEGLESRSRTGFARPLNAQECTRDSPPTLTCEGSLRATMCVRETENGSRPSLSRSCIFFGTDRIASRIEAFRSQNALLVSVPGYGTCGGVCFLFLNLYFEQHYFLLFFFYYVFFCFFLFF